MLKEYVIDLRGYDGKLRELISSGVQEHAFTLGWTGWIDSDNPGEVQYTDEEVLYFDGDGSIQRSFYVDDDFDNTPISPADFLALTPEDVQAEPEKQRFEPKQWVLGRLQVLDEVWCLDRYSHYDKARDKHICLGGNEWDEIIPYETNEHLRGQVGEP